MTTVVTLLCAQIERCSPSRPHEDRISSGIVSLFAHPVWHAYRQLMSRLMPSSVQRCLMPRADWAGI
jgi:hypothetical protein